jgi:hypothetical protein
VHVGNNDVVFGKSFAADDGWARAVSCDLKNISGQVITQLQMNFSFELGNTKLERVSVPLIYSAPIQPDQTVRVSIVPAKLTWALAIRSKGATAMVLKRAELRMDYATFRDGSLWVQGENLGPRDPVT